ncbi:hypothetical protein SAMN04488103_107154 [Gemmobacter aquatilis]|uniref:Uncharacterized protein n=1 Tax=Gemmobacter aquatilis TaxID=933059 RepID=A0A1H8J712_9RHOB|nr:hypothetical protein SAMN04488103_107154 [Gemmobacter aquatilis]
MLGPHVPATISSLFKTRLDLNTELPLTTDVADNDIKVGYALRRQSRNEALAQKLRHDEMFTRRTEK